LIGWSSRQYQIYTDLYEHEYVQEHDHLHHDYAMPTYIRYQVYTFLIAGYDVDSFDYPMLHPHIIMTEAGETQCTGICAYKKASAHCNPSHRKARPDHLHSNDNVSVPISSPGIDLLDLATSCSVSRSWHISLVNI